MVFLSLQHWPVSECVHHKQWAHNWHVEKSTCLHASYCVSYRLTCHCSPAMFTLTSLWDWSQSAATCHVPVNWTCFAWSTFIGWGRWKIVLSETCVTKYKQCYCCRLASTEPVLPALARYYSFIGCSQQNVLLQPCVTQYKCSVQNLLKVAIDDINCQWSQKASYGVVTYKSWRTPAICGVHPLPPLWGLPPFLHRGRFPGQPPTKRSCSRYYVISCKHTWIEWCTNRVSQQCFTMADLADHEMVMSRSWACRHVLRKQYCNTARQMPIWMTGNACIRTVQCIQNLWASKGFLRKFAHDKYQPRVAKGKKLYAFSNHAQSLLRQQPGEVLAKFKSLVLGIRTSSNGDPLEASLHSVTYIVYRQRPSVWDSSLKPAAFVSCIKKRPLPKFV